MWGYRSGDTMACPLLFDVVLFLMVLRDQPAPLLLSVQRAAHVLGTWMEGSLSEEGVTGSEAHILAMFGTERARPLGEIHAAFGHRRSTLTHVMNRLEGRRLVRRVPDPSSRRSLIVETTAAGQSLANDVCELVAWLDETVSGQVSAQDLEGFRRVLATVRQAVDGSPRQATTTSLGS